MGFHEPYWGDLASGRPKQELIKSCGHSSHEKNPNNEPYFLQPSEGLTRYWGAKTIGL